MQHQLSLVVQLYAISGDINKRIRFIRTTIWFEMSIFMRFLILFFLEVLLSNFQLKISLRRLIYHLLWRKQMTNLWPTFPIRWPLTDDEDLSFQIQGIRWIFAIPNPWTVTWRIQKRILHIPIHLHLYLCHLWPTKYNSLSIHHCTITANISTKTF